MMIFCNGVSSIVGLVVCLFEKTLSGIVLSRDLD